MTIKAIAWDIDGTLVNSEPLHLEALKYICEHFYVDIADLADNHFVGINVLDVWAELKPRFPTELTYEGWQTPGRDYYHKQKTHAAGGRRGNCSAGRIEKSRFDASCCIEFRATNRD